MRSFLAFMMVLFVIRANANVGNVVSSASATMTLMDTTVTTNDVMTVRGQMVLPIAYSSSLWCADLLECKLLSISASGEEVLLESEGEGVFRWPLTKGGTYVLVHRVDDFELRKRINVVTPEVKIERLGDYYCELTPSDGESPIRYTLDGSEPTKDSALYTGPFALPLLDLSFVRACTFGDGYPQGVTASGVFGKSGYSVSSSASMLFMDTRAGKEELFVAGLMEIVWSSLWTGDETATAVVSANGKVISSASGEGSVVYSPMDAGTCVLTHQTVKNGMEVGETLVAKVVRSVRVTFDTNGGEDVAPRDVPCGVTIGALPRPARGNDEFVGWFTEPFGGEEIDESYTIQEDVTIYAHWLRANGGPYTEVRDGVTWTFMVAGGVACIGGTGSYLQPAIDPATAGELTIPDELGGRRVTSIKDGAFYCCNQLTSIVVPPNVTSVGYSAFWGCTGVTNLVVNTKPDSYCSWMEWFADCRSVKTATVPGSSSSYADSYGYYTLSRLFPDLEELTFTEGTVSIPAEMCERMEKLSRITLPSSLKAIGRHAFSGCSLLETIDLPEGLTTVGDYAFSDCVSLVSADMPSTVTSMGRDVFAGCKKLIIENLYIPGEAWSVDYNAYYGMEGIKSVVIGEGVYSIGSSAFEGCSGITNVAFPSSLQSIGGNAFRNCIGIGKITLPENLRDLGPQAFYGCTNLTTVTILGDRLWPSGDPFANCVNLTQLNIRVSSSMYPGMLRSSFIGYPSHLLTVNVLGPCGELPRDLFANCMFMKELKLPEGLTKIGYRAVNGCYYLENVEFPTSLKTIDDYAFADCPNLKSVVLPEGLESIGRNAFDCCFRLETPIRIPNSVTNIGERAFYGLDVSDLQFEPENENYVVEDGVLYKLAQGVKVEIVMVSRSAQGKFVASETIKRIAPYAFVGCDDISAIVLPEGLVEIGAFAFSGCNGLAHLTVPASVGSLAGSSIRDVPFDVIDIDSANPIYYKDGRMIYRRTDVGIEVVGVDKDYEGELAFADDIVGIGESACRGCTNVTEFSMGSKIQYVGDYAFYGCNKLMSAVMPDSIGAIGNDCFYKCEALRTASVPSGEIGNYGFAYCGRLESIELGKDVTRIGSEAFYYCSNLVSVVVPESVGAIGSYAFEHCNSLTCVEILGGELGSSVFYGCDALEDVYLGPGVSKIASSAFSNCDSLKRVKIDSTAELGSSAFYYCDALESAEIRSSAVGNYAFEYCRNLTSVVLGPGVGRVGNSAFYGCNGLNEVWISSSVTNIGSQAFYGCSSLKTIHVSSDGDVDAVKQMLSKTGLNVDNMTFDLFDEPIDAPVINPPDGTVFMATNCQVSIRCATPDAVIYYRLGAAPKASSKFLYSVPFTITDTSTIYSFAVKNGRHSPTNVVTLTRGCLLTFAEAASAEGVETFDVGGDADWHAVNDDDAKVGEASVRSGAIEDDQMSWFTTEVEGPGTLSFWWKASCEGDVFQEFDHLVFAVDDVVEGEVARLDGITAWEQITTTIPAGLHTLYWAYVKDESEFDGEDCGWVDGIVWAPSTAPVVGPAIEGDEGATVTGDAETGFVIKPSEGKTAVEVTIPQGVDAAKVTVEVSPKVASVKPNGAKVKIVSGGADITEYLNVPAADGNGVVNLAKATVKEEIVREAMDTEKGAKIELNAADPTLITPNTRVGLFYQLREGVTLEGMSNGDSTIGDGNPWKPEIEVKGGNSAFYSIGVGKGK